MSDGHVHAPSVTPSGGGHTSSGGGGGSFPIGFFGVLCAVIFTIWLYNQVHVNRIPEPRTVHYGPKYGPIERLPPGLLYSFNGATKAYCYINKADSMACADKGKDASDDLGNSSSNKELRFKSRDGVSYGELTIKFFSQ